MEEINRLRALKYQQHLEQVEKETRDKQKNEKKNKIIAQYGVQPDIHDIMATKIQKYVKRKYIKNALNEHNDIIGLYKYRYPIYGDETDMDAYAEESTYTYNEETKEVIETPKPYDNVIVLDISIYAVYEGLPIYCNGFELPMKQKHLDRIQEIWRKINPETTSGIRFNQMLNSSKQICKYFNNENCLQDLSELFKST